MNKMDFEYKSIQISIKHAQNILSELFGITGSISNLPGEIDFNFKVNNSTNDYLLKVSRPDSNLDYIDFQNSILLHVSNHNEVNKSPVLIPSLDGNIVSKIIDDDGNERLVRLLTWIDGRLWSSVNPVNNKLLRSLGEQTGLLNYALQSFDHPVVHRKFEWDIAQANWVQDYLHLFTEEQKQYVEYYLNIFDENRELFDSLRKSVVHNDANDNNVVVDNQLVNPEVVAIIDYGDAIYTQSVNDLAITIAYAIMGKPDLLRAAIPIVEGYNSYFKLKDDELKLLYSLIAVRLVISVTKSAINKQEEPDNSYLLISEKPAWDILRRWYSIDKNFAYFNFRMACGMEPHPNRNQFVELFNKQSFSLTQLLPSINSNSIKLVDMSVESSWLGNEVEYNDNDVMDFKISRLQSENPNSIIAGGYLEPRPIYVTDAYKTESNSGSVYRSVHLGVDFWLPEYTPVHALFDGIVDIAINDAGDKEYGGLIVLKHIINNIVFYTLYGHQIIDSVNKLKKGDLVKKGQKISELGLPKENGNWTSHLHFQIMLDMLGNEHEFPGVTYPYQMDVWRSICPDPNLLFKNENLVTKSEARSSELSTYRSKHLGKSLSLSYSSPIFAVRGSGAFLMDNMGRKYLDTVNNVAHVGHEHLRVVKAGQNQMALLNTNTRYLNNKIVDFAKELLSTFPEELSVVHFVNSGSEANELALRMAKATTGEQDIIAVEVGYHGNTSGCIDISSYKFDGKGGSGAPEYTHIVPLPDSYRGLYEGPNTGDSYASHIKTVLDGIVKMNRNVAAFICESIISCGGQIELPEGYLAKAYELVRGNGGICIADEVQVGCGRVGRSFWGFQLHDVVPDIVTIGKPIGNGHPLAAVVCTQRVANAFANGMEYFNTFGGNPVSCAIGNEVLRVIKDEKLQYNALQTGEYLKHELKVLKQKFPIIGDIRGQGLFLGFELVDGNKNPLPEKTSYLANRMKAYGVLMSVDGKDNNVIKIKPPIIFSIENSNELLLRLYTVLNEDFMKY